MAHLTFKYRVEKLISGFIDDQRGISSIEVAVMFGVVAVGFTLLVSPLLKNKDYQAAQNEGFLGQEVDRMSTGSISKSTHYIIRRSVLQASRTSKCLIYDDGRKVGDC